MTGYVVEYVVVCVYVVGTQTVSEVVRTCVTVPVSSIVVGTATVVGTSTVFVVTDDLMTVTSLVVVVVFHSVVVTVSHQ